MERVSEGIFSSDPLIENKSNDGDDNSSVSSRFSSCEGSELERYGSANSVFGSASICSSIGNGGEYFDSLRSSGPGEDSLAGGSIIGDGHWRNLRHREDTLSGRFDGFSDGETEFSEENSAVNLSFDMKMEGSSLFRSSNENEGDNLVSSGLHVEREELQQLGSPSRSNPVESSSSLEQRVDQGGADPGLFEKSNLYFEGSNLVHYERSDDEGSAIDYGTDSEEESCTIWNGNLNIIGEGVGQQENPLLMNSSVAFGNNDWDEFEREMKVIEVDRLPLKSDQSEVYLTGCNIGELQDAAQNQPSQSRILEVENCSNLSSEENPDYKSMENATSLHKYGNGIREIISNVNGGSSPQVFPVPAREIENKEVGPKEANQVCKYVSL